MDEQEMNGMEEDDVIVFEDEEGNEYSYQIQDYMFYNGEEIESFELVEDDDLAEKLVEIFNTKMAEDEEEE